MELNQHLKLLLLKQEEAKLDLEHTAQHKSLTCHNQAAAMAEALYTKSVRDDQ